MKFKVIRGLRSAADDKGKPRFAVIFDEVVFQKEVWVRVLPCTSYPERTNITPSGSVLLTSNSPAYKGTGFNAEKLAISFRDAAIYRKHSNYLKDAVEVGTLDLSKDNRFEAEWERTKEEAHPNKAKLYEDCSTVSTAQPSVGRFRQV